MLSDKQAGGNVLGNLGSNYHSLINPMIMVNIFVFSSFRGVLQQRTLREWNSRCLEARVGKDSRGTFRQPPILLEKGRGL